MKIRIVIAAVFYSNFLIAQTSYKVPVFNDSERLKKIEAAFPIIDKMFKDHAEQNHFPGMAYGIVVDGKLVFSNAIGYADVNKKVPATTKTSFRIASMSKSFAAMAIVKLRVAGKLHQDDPASR